MSDGGGGDGDDSIDLYSKHPKVPCLHVHAPTFADSARIEGTTDADALVVRNEAVHSHSKWHRGVHVPVGEEEVEVKPSHTGNVFFVRTTCTFVLPMPKDNSTPLRFKFVLAAEHSLAPVLMRFQLPSNQGKDGRSAVWSSASYVDNPKWPSMEPLQRNEGETSFSKAEISVDHGAVTVMTCALQPPNKPAYVIQPCM